jgi:cystathionine beta-lyase
MSYNFDEIVPRIGSNCVKWDLRQAIFGSPDILPLWVADMDFKTPDFIINALKKRLEHEVLGYPVRGKEFFESIISWFRRRHQFEIQKGEIVFCPGVVPALNLCVQAFTQPGDKVIIQPPVYFPFKTAVLENGRQLLLNPLKNEDNSYSFDFEQLKKIIDHRTKLLLLSNPHNPVGRSWKPEELRLLAEICSEHHIIIISDEIHSDLTLKPNKHSILASLSDDISQKSIMLSAPSKTFNLAGLATSFAVIKNPVLRKQFETALEQVHIGLGNIFGNIASEAAYTHGDLWLDELLNYVGENVDYLEEFCQKNIPQISVVRPEATYMAWLDCRRMKLSDEDLKHFFIRKAKLGLNAGIDFGPGGEGFQRINLACPREILRKALEQLKEAFSEQE